MDPIKQHFKARNTCTHGRNTLRKFLEGTCRELGDVSGSYLRIRDLREHGGQTLRQQHSSPAPQQQLRWIYRLISSHSLSLCHSAATLPPLSLFLLFSVCLPAFTCTEYKTGLKRPRVINGDCGVDSFLPSPVICCYAPLSPLLFYHSIPVFKATDIRHCIQLQTASLQWRELARQLGYIN